MIEALESFEADISMIDNVLAAAIGRSSEQPARNSPSS